MSTKRNQPKSIQKPHIPPRLPLIIIAPDKSYVDAEGNVIPTDVILIADLNMYGRMQKVLKAWGQTPIGIPGQRGIIKG